MTTHARLREMFRKGRYDQGDVKQGKVWLRFLTAEGPVYLLVDVTNMIAVTVFSHQIWKENGMKEEFDEVEYKPRPRRQNHRLKGCYRG